MAITSGRNFWCLCSSILLIAAPSAAAETKLFDSVQVTPASEYTFGIEGPAADLDGNLFVVNLGKAGTIGKLPAGAAASELFTTLPEGSVGNAIRFDRSGAMFIADYKKHNIFTIAKGSTEPAVWFHSDEMNQPNDITVARDGTVYASDPNWKGREGHIWRIAKAADGTVQGQVMPAPRAMGTTNGIDLSPDGKTLYVGESSSGQIWSYTISGNELTGAKLVKSFQPDTVDGLRTDVAGRLYVARILKGTIALMKPTGAVEREIALKGKEPTNLAFGGSDGKTVFVTQRQGGFVEAFRTDQPGREHCLQRGRC
ncbi:MULTISPECIES: SMP-30/gluconolactonase/LRE family protein [Bradyrhizobium]|jgi:sugar lactone lactonase YvrE|nr:SMP-30/gluconolactonase/LRE family protein [Bradyrhizobium diazoefficiens]AND87761.1 gluconolactonase [Bradyrhizobium diazoefficiens USDA 110]AWO89280.2 SMP-30/gluconolactonase/LRE family protein [Bradyrhizobium diazoefficiens]QLD45990.1 SMP-30/gluconolactonase/LRE family protein [Bradyrhizobium diazoefficiens]WLA72329.1 SMP-30/gluconolactonase/LRE family protein [Bradyrhizobium diazoefficiens]WLC14573.1 SMP-30/gluconolactonase/LRE family protein [Bradyrhizobium diazoefficiens]